MNTAQFENNNVAFNEPSRNLGVSRETLLRDHPNRAHLFFQKPATPEEAAAARAQEQEELAKWRLGALRKGGFPERAIQAAYRATGPGAHKATGLALHATGEGLLLLLGPTGRGKTVMSVLLAMARQEEGLKPGLFLTAFSLFTGVKSTYGGHKKTSSQYLYGDTKPMVITADDLIAKWSEAPFLVIDEVQTRSETSWEDGLLDEIVNARYAEMLPTVLIANFTPEDAQKNLGPRIMDRARECGGIVNCNWSSYRQ
jgi:DNA replication protein DnaC